MKLPVTIVMPVKVRSDEELSWLDEAVSSAKAQVGASEIIIVNDHSVVQPDWSLYEDNKTRIVDAVGNGLAAAKNQALSLVKTKLFFVLDADDILPVGAISKLVTKYPGDGFLYGSTMFFDDRSKVVYEAQEYSLQRLIKGVFFPNGCLQQKNNWERVGGWNEKLTVYEDWDYWLKTVEACVCPHSVKDIVYYYRRNYNGITYSLKKDEKAMQAAKDKIVELHLESFKGVEPMCSSCGGKKKIFVPSGVAPRTQGQPYEVETMPNGIMVEYIGPSSGKKSIYGPVTGQSYRYSTSNPFFVIDERDAFTQKHNGILDNQNSRVAIFIQANVVLKKSAAGQKAIEE